ncbi:MAG: DegT/DnrJ/EryC1/StrS family aminotransferase [Syntrophales bacterium LBB04]|nr:DegT/DnrJ/EryC1/StrS family aminotransferase [Syntrophales bacterium LBB04]
MKRAKRIFLSPPHMSGEEMNFVKEAFESNYIAPLGPQVEAFEREFAEKVQIPHTLAVSTGTAAMHLALRGLGVGRGDEVLASTLTFIGSVSPIVFQGGIPVFIDSDRTSWNMDPDLLAEELDLCRKRDSMPKAVVPTDLYGQCADLNRILEICSVHGIPVVADAAESLGAFQRMVQNGKNHEALWRHAGVGAKAAIFSFNGNKIITTSGGGMLASEDEAFIAEARFLSQQARDPAPHYEHSQIGHNYRMSNILAAVGRGQLRVLDERVRQKRKIFDRYRTALVGLPGIDLMPEAPYGQSSRWLTVVLIDPKQFGADREAVRLSLEAENIESRPVWKPMHLQPVFGLQRRGAGGPGSDPSKPTGSYASRVVGGQVAEDLFDRGLCLPSGTAMTEEDMERVLETVCRMCRR